MYSVKEIFYTLQGEGTHSGRAAVFMRFTGCNLWTGREQDRASAVCQFCDTDFIGTNGLNGGKFKSATELALKAVEVAKADVAEANSADTESDSLVDGLLIVLTGGEPLLQVDESLIAALHERGFEIAVETNGTIDAPEGLDWICVSPKSGSEVILRQGNELKLVFGQDGVLPEQFVDWEFDHFYLQPMDCADNQRLTTETIEYCKDHPQWKLSLQTHKILNIA